MFAACRLTPGQNGGDARVDTRKNVGSLQHHGGVRPRADAAEFDDLIPPKGPVLVTGAT